MRTTAPPRKRASQRHLTSFDSSCEVVTTETWLMLAVRIGRLRGAKATKLRPEGEFFRSGRIASTSLNKELPIILRS